jgi:hypothetical protein
VASCSGASATDTSMLTRPLFKRQSRPISLIEQSEEDGERGSNDKRGWDGDWRWWDGEREGVNREEWMGGHRLEGMGRLG